MEPKDNMYLHEAIHLIRTGQAKAFCLNEKPIYFYSLLNNDKNKIKRWNILLGITFFESHPGDIRIELVDLDISLSDNVRYKKCWQIYEK